MPIPAIRAKQTTNTTGTGTLTLNAVSSEFRGFSTAFGASSIQVRYALSRAGVYEVGYGTFNGGTPGTLTRTTVVASSNAGALVNLAAGTTDVFFDFLPGDRPTRTVSATATLDLTDIGNLIRCTPGADMTINLPAIATVPPGMGYLIANQCAAGTYPIVSIDPNGSELLEGVSNAFPLFATEAVEIFSNGASWRMGARPTGKRLAIRQAASASASVDFVLPHYVSAARSVYELQFRQVRMGTDGAILLMRTDDAGGASFDAGASDYTRSLGVVTGTAAWAGFATLTDTAMHLSTDQDTGAAGNTILGQCIINPGAGGVRFPGIEGSSLTQGNGGTYAGPQKMVFAGYRNTAMDINAIRLLASTGNINLGDFSLFATYD